MTIRIKIIVLLCNVILIYGLEIKVYPDIFLPLGPLKNMANIVDVHLKDNIYLNCGENSEDNTWFFKQRGSDTKSWQKPKIRHNTAVTLDKILIITRFTLNNSGIYVCKRDGGVSDEENLYTYVVDGIYVCKRDGGVSDEENLYTYVVDGVFKDNPKMSGTFEDFKLFKTNEIDLINEMFEKSNREPYASFSKIYKFSFRLITSWEDWGPCQSNRNREYIRKRKGHCRLHPFRRTLYDKMNGSAIEGTESLFKYYMLDGYDVSCRSIKLNENLPEISRLVRYIPEYEIAEPCVVDITSSFVLKQKDDVFKYSDIRKIVENGHFTFICPEVSRDSRVEWYKNMRLLNSSFRDNMGESEEEPHLSIDSNILYILHATKNEEGLYSCTVDGKRMQKIDLKVVSKSVLLNHEFLKYSCYLAFVLSLTVTCYCAGICIAWHRRSSFFDPLNFNGKQYPK